MFNKYYYGVVILTCSAHCNNWLAYVDSSVLEDFSHVVCHEHCLIDRIQQADEWNVHGIDDMS